MRIVLLSSLVLMVSLVSVKALSTSIDRNEAYFSHLGYYTEAACTVQCHLGCEFGEGKWPGDDAEKQGGSGGGGHHPECMAGQNCATIHGCGGNETFHPDPTVDSLLRRQHVERVFAIQEAVAAGSVSAALELLGAYPDHAVYNEERRSIQLFGCSKEVLSGNLPLSDDQLAAVLANQ